MTAHVQGADGAERRLSPADVRNVRFPRANVLRPGYSDTEVDRFVHRLGQELSRLIAEKAELRDQVRALQQRITETPAPEAPSDQAVRILATAQQTADEYVAEAEEFSRQMSHEARTRYEEQLREARENAGAIIAAAQEAAAKVSGGGRRIADANPDELDAEELREQVAYLKAFGQAVRTQLRHYLEALLTDVESEWGRADPAMLPQGPIRTPAERQGSPLNVAADVTRADSANGGGSSNGVEVSGARR